MAVTKLKAVFMSDTIFYTHIYSSFPSAADAMLAAYYVIDANVIKVGLTMSPTAWKSMMTLAGWQQPSVRRKRIYVGTEQSQATARWVDSLPDGHVT